MKEQEDLEQYKYRCNKCQKKVYGGKSICSFCRICLCDECNTTLTVLNFYIATTKESHTECGKQVNLV